MIDVAPSSTQVDEQRGVSVEPEGASRDEGPLDAMGSTLSEHPDDRQGGGPVALVVPPQPG
jgi:hypothetical protein